MDVILSILQILLIISLIFAITYAVKQYKDGRKSIIIGAFFALLGAFFLVAQFVGSNRLDFHNSDAFIVSLAQISPGLILIFIGWKLLKGKRTKH